MSSPLAGPAASVGAAALATTRAARCGALARAGAGFATGAADFTGLGLGGGGAGGGMGGRGGGSSTNATSMGGEGGVLGPDGFRKTSARPTRTWPATLATATTARRRFERA